MIGATEKHCQLARRSARLGRRKHVSDPLPFPPLPTENWQKLLGHHHCIIRHHWSVLLARDNNSFAHLLNGFFILTMAGNNETFEVLGPVLVTKDSDNVVDAILNVGQAAKGVYIH